MDIGIAKVTDKFLKPFLANARKFVNSNRILKSNLLPTLKIVNIDLVSNSDRMDTRTEN